MVVNMEIGMLTPPVGLNLFVTSGVAGMSMIAVVRAALPFLGIMFFVFNYRDLCAANINLSARYAVGTREGD